MLHIVLSIHANFQNFISLHDFQPQRFRSKKRFTTFGHITSIQTANTRVFWKIHHLHKVGH